MDEKSIPVLLAFGWLVFFICVVVFHKMRYYLGRLQAVDFKIIEKRKIDSYGEEKDIWFLLKLKRKFIIPIWAYACCDVGIPIKFSSMESVEEYLARIKQNCPSSIKTTRIA